MTCKISHQARMRIAEFLPDAIATALTSYHRFSQNGMSGADGEEGSVTAKEFSDHHRACKVAIAHIELLLKLAKFAELPDAKAKNGNQQIMLAALVQEAQEEVRAYHDKEESDKN